MCRCGYPRPAFLKQSLGYHRNVLPDMKAKPIMTAKHTMRLLSCYREQFYVILCVRSYLRILYASSSIRPLYRDAYIVVVSSVINFRINIHARSSHMYHPVMKMMDTMIKLLLLMKQQQMARGFILNAASSV